MFTLDAVIYGSEEVVTVTTICDTRTCPLAEKSIDEALPVHIPFSYDPVVVENLDIGYEPLASVNSMLVIIPFAVEIVVVDPE